MNPGGAEALLWEKYRAYIARGYREDFGVTNAALADAVAGDWFHCDERHDFQFDALTAAFAPGVDGNPATSKPCVLDLASGMGSTVLRGLQRGINVFGIEPDPEKLSLLGNRVEAGAAERGWERGWKGRFVRGVGETLPFRDGAFDVVLSYQTLEHVQDLSAVLGEMLRVTGIGGALHLRCPDYTGTFEGHYQLPWLPLLPRPLARVWLRLCGRPVRGFEGIGYVTPNKIRKLLEANAAKAGLRVTITNLEQERYRARLRERGMPGWRGPAFPWRALYYLKRMFRVELQVNLWVSIQAGPVV